MGPEATTTGYPVVAQVNQGEQYTAIKQRNEGTSLCSNGWYQIVRPNGTRFAVTHFDTDPADGVPDVWICANFVSTNQPAGSLQFSSSSFSFNEGSGNATITVTRTGGSNGAVGVTFTTSNGTAQSGSDYTAVNTTVSFGNGDTVSKTVNVPITNDSSFEGNETVNLTLSNPTGGASLGSPNSAVLTILDDDTAPAGSLQFSSSSYSFNEGSGNATITVTRTGGSNGAVGVTFTTSNGTAQSGSDYTFTAQTVSFANGDTANKTVNIPIINDSTFEGNETVNLTLSNPTGGASLGSPSTAVMTILDDDQLPPGVIFQDDMESGSGSWIAQFPWQLTPAQSHSATHSWTDSPNGNYNNNVNASLFSPTLNLTGFGSVSLSFWHKHDLTAGDGANIWVTTDNQMTYQFVKTFPGTATSWTHETVDLSAFAGQPSVQIVFQLLSNGNNTADGWYIDDVVVKPHLLDLQAVNGGAGDSVLTGGVEYRGLARGPAYQILQTSGALQTTMFGLNPDFGDITFVTSNFDADLLDEVLLGGREIRGAARGPAYQLFDTNGVLNMTRFVLNANFVDTSFSPLNVNISNGVLVCGREVSGLARGPAYQAFDSSGTLVRTQFALNTDFIMDNACLGINLDGVAGDEAIMFGREVTGAGRGPALQVFNSNGSLRFTQFVLNPSFTETKFIVADIGSNGIIAYGRETSGLSRGPAFQTFGASGNFILTRFVLNANFTNLQIFGANTTNAVAGDEIVTGGTETSGLARGPAIQVWDKNGNHLFTRFVLNPDFTEVTFSKIDIDNDGVHEIIAVGRETEGLARGPALQLFDGSGNHLMTRFVLNSDFINLKFFAIDVTGDGDQEIGIGGVETNGFSRGPAYQVFESNGNLLQTLFVLNADF